MEITYNGLTYNKDIITLSGVPNILTFTGTSTVNRKDKWRISFTRLINVEVNTVYHIYFNDYQISSVPELYMQGGTNFYMPASNSYANRLILAQSVTKAARNIPYIAANYDVWLDDDEDGTMQPIVNIQSKKPGALYNITVTTDFPTADYQITHQTTGVTDDDMLQGNTNSLSVDIYRYTNQTKIGDNPNPQSREYITTLEKGYSGKPISFNLTPVLSTFVENGEMAQYMMTIYGFSNGLLKFSHVTEPCFITQGYQVNQSEPFIGTFTNRMLAQDVSRGDDRDQFNKTHLYLYYPTVPFSMYTKNGITQTQVTVNYIGSAGNTILSQNFSVWATDSHNSLGHYELSLSKENFAKSNYVDLVIPDVGTVRYNVIKPLNAADERDCRRILWYNEYGGISFIDLTGELTVQRKEEIELYQKQNFDFYTADGREENRVYSKEMDIVYKHKTHYIDENGKYLLYSLQASSTAWTEINGRKYYIVITNLEIKEASNTSHIFTGEIEYQMSYPEAT